MPQHEDSIARKPLQRFKRLTGSLETLISSIARDWEDLATAPAADAVGLLEDDGPTVHGKMRKAQLLFTELHSTTRKTHSAIETIRNKVATAKQSMDVNHLQLENLLYERDYLSRETQLCKDFTMTELNKMEEEEEQGFLEDVDTLQTPEEHAGNLAILQDQKDQRISAQQALKATQIRVKAANSVVKESRDYLDRLPENLKDVERALAPLKKNMPWRPGSRRGRHERSSELPGPLFTLYCQLEAFCDSVLAATGGMDESGAVSALATFGGDVAGDRSPPGLAASVTIEPAKPCVSASAKAAAARSKDASDSAEAPAASTDSSKGSSEPDSKRPRLDCEQGDGGSGVAGGGEGGVRLKRTISRREAGKATLDALRPSPLEVQLTLNFGDRKSDAGAAPPKASGSTSTADTFKVRFSFLPSLGIVAVRPAAAHDSRAPLANLFPTDTGKDTPNPANHHNKAAQASPLGVFEYPADVPCRPYRWAQRLAGLHFPPAAEGGRPVAATTMPIEPTTRSAVAALRSRARTLEALGGQLKALSDGKGPSPLPGSRDEAVAESVELRSWKELSGSELQQASSIFQKSHASKSKSIPGGGEEAEAVSCSDRKLWERFGARYFKGTVSSQQGGKERTVHVHVEVPAEYPLRPSLISLTEDIKPDADAAGDAALREELCTVANEVNAHYDTLLTEDVGRWDHLLSHQLLLVMKCLASKAGTLGRLRKGRMRRKPVVFEHLERKFVDRGSLLTARTDPSLITLTPMEM
ncbi:unnamed protein product [Ectocarpus fasciculatus]